VAASEDWDPAAASAPGYSVGPESWDPDPSIASGSSTGPRSWDPDSLTEELPSSCMSCGPGRSATSTMLTASEVATI
jgi:hypothetical protein